MLHWGLHRYEGTTIVPKYKAHSGIGPALNRADPYHDTHSLIHAHTNQPTNQSYLRSECSQNDRNQRSPVVPYNQIRPEVGRKEGGEGGEGRERWEEEEGGKKDDYNTPIPIFLAWQPDVALVSTRFRPQCRHDWASDRSAADSYPHV